MMVKLVSGEEVLCKFTKGDETSKIDTPIILVPRGEELVVIPWLNFANKPEITVKNEHIVFTYVPKPEIVNQYNELTGSIVTVSAGALDNKGKLVL